MTCGIVSLFLILAFSSLADGQQDFNTVSANARHVPDEIIVKFKPDVGEELINAINLSYGTWTFHRSRLGGFNRVLIPQGKSVEEMVESFRALKEVEYAEPNYIARAFMVPNDPYYHAQWHMDNATYGGIQMEEAWDIEPGGDPSVVVAVVDTGVAYENYKKVWKTYYKAPDLVNTAFVAGYDFVEDDTHPNDDNSHGTHVAGTIAQSTNNAIGVAGVAFKCSIMPVKVLDRNGYGTYADVADGIIYAADNGAKVINLSLGGPDPSTTLENAVAHAYAKGVTVVAAAGNEYGSGNAPQYPAAYDKYVIAVGATRYDENHAPYSNTGNYLDLTAPGGDLSVDLNKDGYGDGVLQNTFNPNTKNTKDFGYWFFDGTSMAAPHVSGVAALVISHKIATTADEVRQCLESTAEDKGALGWDPIYGWGIVDAYAALKYVPGNRPPVANAGPDQTVTDTDGNNSETVTLNGSGSYDPDGEIMSYVWNEGNSELGTGVTLTVELAVGIHTITLTVTDDDGATDTDEAVVTVNPKPPEKRTHVASIDMTLRRSGWYRYARAVVAIADQDGIPVTGASVTGQWSGRVSGSAQGTTNGNGKVTFDSPKTTASRGTISFTVTGVSAGGCTYDPNSNVETSDSVSW
jgi:serine protease